MGFKGAEQHTCTCIIMFKKLTKQGVSGQREAPGYAPGTMSMKKLKV